MDDRVGVDDLRQVKKTQDLPKNAVLLTEEEVLHIQNKRILNWLPSSEVLALQYGSGVMAGTSAGTAILVNSHFRQKYFLRNLGRMSTFAPAVIVPTLMAALTHQLFITHKFLLGQIPACEMCMSTRSGLIQTAAGALYPMLISPLACIAVARKYNTYAVPPATQPKEVLGMMRQVFPTQSRLILLCAVNFFAGVLFADLERNCARNTVLKDRHPTPGFSKEGFP